MFVFYIFLNLILVSSYFNFLNQNNVYILKGISELSWTRPSHKLAKLDWAKNESGSS